MPAGDFYDTDPTQPTGVEDDRRGEGLLTPGDAAGDYIVTRKIGWGGCSTVYSAENTKDGSYVAVKVMHPGLAESPRQVERFQQEARTLQGIDHPTIVKVFHIGELPDKRPYIAMELLKGTNLAALLQTRGRFSAMETVEILEPICEALHIAHEKGVVHRDIKASNIIIESGPGKRTVKLLDFGIAKLVGPGSSGMQTTAGHILGTPHSMAPEQIKGRPVDQRTDVYGLGALLYRMLTGKHPFEGYDAVALTRMHLDTPVPLPSQSAPVSPDVDAVVRRAMEKDPDKRYETALAFLEGLRDAVGAAAPRLEKRLNAVAIYVDAQVQDGAVNDEDVLDDLMAVLDIAEETFQEHDVLIPLQTGNAILGAMLVPTPAAEEEIRTRAMNLASSLDEDLLQRDDADQRVRVNICLHMAEALVRMQADPPEVIGGPILDVGSWAPARTIEGVCATPETLGMALEARDRNARSYVRIGAITPH